MRDTLIHIKGFKKDSFREDNFWSHKFVVRHETPEQLGETIEHAMDDIFRMQGMIVIKDELVKKTPENMMFIPMHMLARIEVETKLCTGRYDVVSERAS